MPAPTTTIVQTISGLTSSSRTAISWQMDEAPIFRTNFAVLPPGSRNKIIECKQPDNFKIYNNEVRTQSEGSKEHRQRQTAAMCVKRN
mmetsp:Transcript_163949/g.521188  ORF Transcript_163949/g.521188 Transcript_163949/m.521188 type:complete len:88 (+) Transcript_163949:283-546(+)